MAFKFTHAQLSELAKLDFGSFDWSDSGVALNLTVGGQVWCSNYLSDRERLRGMFKSPPSKPYLATFDVSEFFLPRTYECFDDPITAAIWLITEHSNRL